VPYLDQFVIASSATPNGTTWDLVGASWDIIPAPQVPAQTKIVVFEDRDVVKTVIDRTPGAP